MTLSIMLFVFSTLIVNAAGSPIWPNQVRQFVAPTSTVMLAAPTTTGKVNGHIDGTGKFGLKIGLAFLVIIFGGSLLGALVYRFCIGGSKKTTTRPTQTPSNSYRLRDMGTRNGGGAGRHWPQPSYTPPETAGSASPPLDQLPTGRFPSIHRAGTRSPIDWAEYDQVDPARNIRFASRGRLWSREFNFRTLGWWEKGESRIDRFKTDLKGMEWVYSTLKSLTFMNGAWMLFLQRSGFFICSRDVFIINTNT